MSAENPNTILKIDFLKHIESFSNKGVEFWTTNPITPNTTNLEQAEEIIIDCTQNPSVTPLEGEFIIEADR